MGIAVALALGTAAPAAADDDASGWFAPLTAPLGDDWTAGLGVNLSGAAYADRQDGDVDRDGVQAFAIFAPSVSRKFGDDWEIGIKGSILAYHDHLSGDNYGNDVFELGYFYAQTPYGRLEVGQQNGTAYSQSVTAPVVDNPAAINDANVTFFKDRNGNPFIGIFNLRTGIFTSINDAKINYIAPRLSGFQIGVSYTPNDAKGPLPFLSRDHHVPDRVTDILEGSANYTAQWDNWSVQASAGLAAGHNAAPTPGQDGVHDWGTGVEADYALDDAKLSFGAAYRVSNAYTFAIDQAFRHGDTSNVDVGAIYTKGPWMAGVEYETGYRGWRGRPCRAARMGLEPVRRLYGEQQSATDIGLAVPAFPRRCRHLL